MKASAKAKVKKNLHSKPSWSKEALPNKTDRKGPKPELSASAALFGSKSQSTSGSLAAPTASQKRLPRGKLSKAEEPPGSSQGNNKSQSERRPPMNKIYAGIDLHSNNLVCALVDQAGHRLKHQRLDNRLGLVLEFLQPYQSRLQTVAVEGTFNWYWLVDGLIEQDYPVDLANAAAIRQYDGLKHGDDESDAYFLAELARLDILPTGHICSKEQRPYRDLLRRRMLLVQQRTSQMLSLKSLYARMTGQTLSQGLVKSLSIEEVPKYLSHVADRQIATEQVRLMEQFTQGIRQIEKTVEKVADQLPCYARLQELPGIGRILALTITMETDQISRFASPEDFASYCRCVKAERESNGQRKGFNNEKCGNKYLAWAFVEAAHGAIRTDAACRRFYERKKAKTNAAVATKALACKLAKAAWHVMKKNEPYDPARVFPFLREKNAAVKA